MPDIVLLFLYVPVVTGFIGWVTNWAAVKMIFWPRNFIGVGPLGWQGILYKQSHKFATNVANMATQNLLTSRELVSRIKLDEIEVLFDDILAQHVNDICRDAAELIKPGSWEGLPEHVRGMIIGQVKLKTREISRALFDELEGQAEELVDLHGLVYTQLSGANVSRLAEFTYRIGHKEFKFIEWYGGVFGFLIGLAQIGIWSIMQTWWLMPIVGVIVGLVTNWLAIEMIFRPQEPKKYFGLVTYQGLFPKRQAEIARDYGQVSGEELLTPRNLIEFVMKGESGARITELVTRTITTRVDDEWNKVKAMIPIAVTDEQRGRIKASILARLMAAAPEVQPRLEEHLAGKLGVAETVETRLATLSKPAFERVLRGIFEEDELTLIVVGGVLGGLVGVLQGAMVLAI